ncbi:response regulator containing a CheY-like receiver domain and an HTH DNA-binding domain [Desulfitobacterium dehalogenans ATCC 51507]|uniref:Stage 0 sporulation protein A homolog n=1 Tax=Desulfitobacterium dehalogenans (strain ATCC 51507 / DSM 9161 / JW/IU-DC1) TaxID=756499 RepID=I4A3P7_DESDJ|nr:response regulator transcription factor [Desulfitobacterium dehalogenans]AFL98581.1 response regulator containing a CheY-like receiver domain and an HTH DNA-binding domain [Desulfitobacterium dehalogenans ATCC 51507]
MSIHWEKSKETEEQVHLLIVDSHRPFAEGTRALLSFEPRIVTIGIAGDKNSCLNFLCDSVPDVVLLDFYLPDIGGLDLMDKIKAAHPDLKVILMVEQSQEGYVLAASRKGAEGLLLKTCAVEEMIQAVLSVSKGGVYFSPSPSAFPKVEIDFNDLYFPVKPAEVLKRLLTPREKEIMCLLTKGLHNREIAAALGITVRAAHLQVKIILLKFGVNTRLEAVLSWAYVDG